MPAPQTPKPNAKPSNKPSTQPAAAEKPPQMIVQAPPTFNGSIVLQGYGITPLNTEVEVAFRHMGRKAFSDLASGLSQNQSPASEVLCLLVDGVYDFEGRLQPATPAMFEQWMDDFPQAFADVFKAYSDHLLGERLKN